MRRRQLLTDLLMLSGASALHPSLHAQFAWPAKPIKLIVPYPPGGGTDVNGRLLADRIGPALKTTIIVDNRPGAGGNLGMDIAAKSAPDGYTLALGQTSNLAINSTLFPHMPYDALKDFAPVALVAMQPTILVVAADSNMKSFADFVTTAKADSAGLAMASAGSGTVGHLVGEMLARRIGMKLLHVPYKGASPALTDLLGGQVALFFASSGAIMPQITSGKVRALAVTSAKRSAQLPDVPTVAESGFPDFEATDWKALVAPARTPMAIVERLNLEVGKMLAQTSVREKLAAEGSEPLGGTVEHFAKFLIAENAKWGKIVKDSGAKVG